jgi:hypothetical protein
VGTHAKLTEAAGIQNFHPLSSVGSMSRDSLPGMSAGLPSSSIEYVKIAPTTSGPSTTYHAVEQVSRASRVGYPAGRVDTPARPDTSPRGKGQVGVKVGASV